MTPTVPGLESLREVHLPGDPSWWPPAPGWWLLLILLALVVVAIVWWRRRSRLPKSLAAIPLDQEIRLALQKLEDDFQQSGDAPALAAEVSILMKRVAMAKHGREQVAGLTGGAWADFLIAQGVVLSSEERLWLQEAPYCLATGEAANGLFQVAKRWLLGGDHG